MISGFVLYRSGYFDSTETETTSSLHVSPNGGELLNTTVVDTNQQKISEAISEPIMPSSKSSVPIFDMEKYEEQRKNERMFPSSKSATHLIDGKPFFLDEIKLDNPFLYSSKSMIFPVEIKYNPEVSSLQNRQAIQVQPELIEEESKKEDSTKAYKQKVNQEKASKGDKIKKGAPPAEKEKHKGIAWSTIGMGLLGIVFVSIGSIVYFKRRSK